MHSRGAIILRQAAYYAALESVARSLDVTEWLASFADTVLAAQKWSERRLIRLIKQARMFDRLRGRLNPRQERLCCASFERNPTGSRAGRAPMTTPHHTRPPLHERAHGTEVDVVQICRGNDVLSGEH